MPEGEVFVMLQKPPQTKELLSANQLLPTNLLPTRLPTTKPMLRSNELPAGRGDTSLLHACSDLLRDTMFDSKLR
jgi:hypothetical protein